MEKYRYEREKSVLHKVTRHATDGQPDGDKTHEENGEEGEKEVGGLDADRVGIDDKRAFAGTQLDLQQSHPSSVQPTAPVARMPRCHIFV